MAEALKVNKTLETLILRCCGVGDDGAAALAEALRSNTSLLYLDLKPAESQFVSNSDTLIGEKGKQLLRDAVAGRQRFNLHV